MILAYLKELPGEGVVVAVDVLVTNREKYQSVEEEQQRNVSRDGIGYDCSLPLLFALNEKLLSNCQDSVAHIKDVL